MTTDVTAETPFFSRPILNSPYELPDRHWEFGGSGQPTQQVIESRRWAAFITPIPKPKKCKAPTQGEMSFDEGRPQHASVAGVRGARA